MEFISLILNIIAVIQSIQIGPMYEIERERGKVITKTRVDKYIIFFQIISMVFSLLSTICVFILMIICEKALEYIGNKVDRRVLKRNRKIRIGSESIDDYRYRLDRYYSV